MTQEEIDDKYLYDQYVLTLKNDGKWYRRTREAIKKTDYAQYCSFSWPFINALMTENRDSSSKHANQRYRTIPPDDAANRNDTLVRRIRARSFADHARRSAFSAQTVSA